jgi:hypothetical protein
LAPRPVVELFQPGTELEAQVAGNIAREGESGPGFGANESFNGKLRDECLSAEWFRTRQQARAVIEGWR